MIMMVKQRSSLSGKISPFFCRSKAILKQSCIFLLGCALTTTVFLNSRILAHPQTSAIDNQLLQTRQQQQQQQKIERSQELEANTLSNRRVQTNSTSFRSNDDALLSLLSGIRVLVAIVAYDFSQLPHLEEVLDTYADLCVIAHSHVDIVVYSTVPWPVTYLDLFNTRFATFFETGKLSIQVHLYSPSVKLHLVDFHRELFYTHLEEYDLFVYSEDDIRVSPKTIATYLWETRKIRQAVGDAQSSDFNVGIVRYEYNYPPEVIIDDKTRHATQNVTRVYWEHSWHPAIPKSVDRISPQLQALLSKTGETYLEMKNPHQGMYLATRDLLHAWKLRKGCNFDRIQNRPGLARRPSQPAEGTQRVWMSSIQLLGKSHCGVQQVLPLSNFGALTVHHLPNKNYRRVGRKGRIGGSQANASGSSASDLNSNVSGPSNLLLTALTLHLQFYRQWPQLLESKRRIPYRGIQMQDHVHGQGSNSPLLVRRMTEYHEYVQRGGILSSEDLTKTELVEPQ